eukprot:GILJ01004594.1.p1 GENE.GILJ01004594.1~~GILJ01004594.1.p1  ORF type:complete len:452 (+),score=26.02 GILJ01004594.1:180-1358(+)
MASRPDTSAFCTLEEAGYCLPSLEGRFLITDGRFSSGGSQSNYHSLYDVFIKDLLYEVGTECGIRVVVDRHVADPSRQTQATLRPDFLLWVNDVLFVKGEEESENMSKAINDLTNKLNPWVLGVGKLPYVLCYAAVGPFVNFYAVDPSNNLSVIHSGFNLELQLHRCELIKFSLNIVRLLLTFKHFDCYPTYVPPIGSVKRRNNGVQIFFRHDGITKTVPGANVALLQQVYAALSDCRYTVQGTVSVSGTGVVKVNVSPLCCLARPTNIGSLLLCIRHISLALKTLHRAGFVHRDVRWDNVLLNPRGGRETWILCDFETAAPMNVVDLEYRSAFAHPPELLFKDGVWTAACDFFQLGLMLTQMAWATEHSEVKNLCSHLSRGACNVLDDFVE